MAQGPRSSILVTIWITVRIQESEVRNPDSLDYRKNYQRILMKFYGELCVCGLVTFWWRSGSGSPFRITIRIPREELPRCQLCWRSAEVCALWVLLAGYVCINEYDKHLQPEARWTDAGVRILETQTNGNVSTKKRLENLMQHNLSMKSLVHATLQGLQNVWRI